MARAKGGSNKPADTAMPTMASAAQETLKEMRAGGDTGNPAQRLADLADNSIQDLAPAEDLSDEDLDAALDDLPEGGDDDQVDVPETKQTEAQRALIASLEKQGWNGMDAYSSDQELLEDFQGTFAENHELRTRLAQLEQQMSGGGKPAVEEQKAPAPQPAPDAAEYKMPDWDPAEERWLTTIKDSEGRPKVVAIEGAPDGVVQRFHAFNRAVDQRQVEFFRNPQAFLDKYTKGFARVADLDSRTKEVESRIQGNLRKEQEQYQINQFRQAPGYYEFDAAGKVKIHPKTGAPLRSASGVAFDVAFEQFKKDGMSEMRALERAYQYHPPVQHKAPAAPAKPERKPTIGERARSLRGPGGRPNRDVNLDNDGAMPRMADYAARALADSQ